MGIEYYGFALFVAILVGLIVLLCNHLFSDVKRQRKMLDEKETKLLRLYQSLEDAMDEFDDSVAELQTEMDKKWEDLKQAADRQIEKATAAPAPAPVPAAPAKREAAPAAAPVPVPVAEEVQTPAPAPKKQPAAKATKGTKAAAAKADFGEVLTHTDDAQPVQAEGSANKNDLIILLSKQGKGNAQIAQELGITRSEVDLVLGMMQG